MRKRRFNEATGQGEWLATLQAFIRDFTPAAATTKAKFWYCQLARRESGWFSRFRARPIPRGLEGRARRTCTMLTEKVHLIQFKLHFHISGSASPPTSVRPVPARETCPAYPLVFATYGSISLKSFSTHTQKNISTPRANYNPALEHPLPSCTWQLCYLNLHKWFIVLKFI